MDKKKIPHGIEALRELFIQFDEAGYEPTEPGHAVYGGSSGSDFKNALMVAINGCICEELSKFFYSLKKEFELEDFDGYFLEYLDTLNWLDKLKDLSYGSLQFEYAGNGNNFQENLPARRDKKKESRFFKRYCEKRSESESVLFWDLSDLDGLEYDDMAEALYRRGWRHVGIEQDFIDDVFVNVLVLTAAFSFVLMGVSEILSWFGIIAI